MKIPEIIAEALNPDTDACKVQLAKATGNGEMEVVEFEVTEEAAQGFLKDNIHASVASLVERYGTEVTDEQP